MINGSRSKDVIRSFGMTRGERPSKRKRKDNTHPGRVTISILLADNCRRSGREAVGGGSSSVVSLGGSLRSRPLSQIGRILAWIV